MSTHRWSALAGIAFIFAAALLYGGSSVLHLSTACIPRCEIDPNLYVWMFRWMEHAVFTQQNPFFTPMLGAPQGISLYWITSVSTQAFLGLPFTVLFGAQASYNLMVLIGLGASAWAVSLLCLEITAKRWPSAIAGGLFLVNSYTVYEVVHINLLFVAPLVFFARLLIRYTRGLLGTRCFGLLGGLLLVAQFFASTEIFATASLFGAIAVAFYLVLDAEDWRADLRILARGLAVAYAVFAIATSPFLLHALDSSPAPAWSLTERSVDLPEILIPGELTAVGTWAAPLRKAAGIESGYPDSGHAGYLMLPILALLVAAWRDRPNYPRMLLPLIGSTLLLSLGPRIEVFKGIRIPGPYALLSHLPLLEHAFPKRFPLYAWIAISVVLSIWLSSRQSGDRQRTTLWILIGAVMALPGPANLGPAGNLDTASFRPEFFRTAQHRWFLRESDVVFAVTPLSMELQWQTTSEFSFRLSEGYLGPYAPWSSRAVPYSSRSPNYTPNALRAFVASRQVDWIALPAGGYAAWRDLLRRVVADPPIGLGGVDLYRVSAVPRLSPGEPSRPAQAAFRRGVEASSQGLLTDAAAEFRRVLALRPKNRFAHNEMAKIYLAYGDTELAEVHLRAALIENPDYVAPMLELARLWASEGRTGPANGLYRRVFLLRPSALTEEEREHVVKLLSTAPAPAATP